MILAHLGSPNPTAGPPPPTTAAAFPEMPPSNAFFESYERHGMTPTTAAAAGNDMPGGRVNYVVPSAAETAAIAAQARMKRSRGNTMPR